MGIIKVRLIRFACRMDASRIYCIYLWDLCKVVEKVLVWFWKKYREPWRCSRRAGRNYLGFECV